MSTITLNQFMDFIKENITADEKHQKDVLRYFLTEFKGTEGEYIETEVEPVLILEQCDNLFVPYVNIYINIKKTTIFVVACLFDIFFTKGIAVGIATIAGYIEKSLHLISPENVCLFSKIAYYDNYYSGVTLEELVEEFDGSCNSTACKRCPHRIESDTCGINRDKIIAGLNELVLSKTIIPDAENKYHLN